MFSLSNRTRQYYRLNSANFVRTISPRWIVVKHSHPAHGRPKPRKTSFGVRTHTTTPLSLSTESSSDTPYRGAYARLKPFRWFFANQQPKPGSPKRRARPLPPNPSSPITKLSNLTRFAPTWVFPLVHLSAFAVSFLSLAWLNKSRFLFKYLSPALSRGIRDLTGFAPALCTKLSAFPEPVVQEP